MHFFHLNLLNAQAILASKIYDVGAIFCQFSDIKNMGWSQQPKSTDSLLLVSPSALELAILRKANLPMSKCI